MRRWSTKARPLMWCLVALVFGCVAPQPKSSRPAAQVKSLSAMVREQPVAVKVSPTFPPLHYQLPADKGHGMLAGAKKGAKSGDVMAEKSGLRKDPVLKYVITPLAIATSTVGTIGGAIGGAVRGMPEEERLAAEQGITNALGQVTFGEWMSGYLLQAARRRGLTNFADWNPPVAEGAAVLELTPVSVRLAGVEAVNPPLKLTLALRATLRQSTNMLCAAEMTYESALARKFGEWGAEGGRAVREEIGNAAHFLAGRVLELNCMVQPGKAGQKTKAKRGRR